MPNSDSFGSGGSTSAIGPKLMSRIQTADVPEAIFVATQEMLYEEKIFTAVEAKLSEFKMPVPANMLSNEVLNPPENTGEAAQNEVDALKKVVIETCQTLKDEGITNRQLGPAIAGAYDKTTGKTYIAINSQTSKLPEKLHPLIAERIENMPLEIYNSYKEKTKGAGTHAEIYAANEALLANPEASPANITIYVNRTLGVNMPAKEAPFPRCPHCAYILEGFNVVSG